MYSKISSWGNYPKIKNVKFFNFNTEVGLREIVKTNNNLIIRGNGRSYGDSALSKSIICNKKNRYFLDFDDKTGELYCQSGVLLSEILNVFVPKGWFLSVTPGTKFVTVGGAIASDVHGKNHHLAGCFSNYVVLFNLMLPSGDVVECSEEKNSELFRASCGGMGLTGVILDAKIKLQKIASSTIEQTTIKTKNLEETFAAFELYKNSPYSMAWIDCLAKGDSIGRCLLTVGKFNDNRNTNYQTRKKINIPFYLPSFVLNNFSMKLFNFLYYYRVFKKISNQKVGIDDFFYPLDKINNWNRIYGKQGLIQYQFVLPKRDSNQGLKEILQQITQANQSPFLAVLKLFGKANNNYLSFPQEGYTLALDFKITKNLFPLLNKLDELVVKYHGRIYLTKDARVSKTIFEQGYSDVAKFRALRKNYQMNKKFNSLQSKRLEL